MDSCSFEVAVKDLYKGVDQAHGWEHIKAVEEAAVHILNEILPEERSMRLWKVEGLMESILLHDIGRAIPGDNHEETGAALIEATPWLMEHLQETAPRVVEAVRCHRASTPYQGSDILVMVLRDADRLSTFLGKGSEQILDRALAYGRHHYPELTEEQQLQRAKTFMRGKYGKGGYALEGLHFECTKCVIQECIAEIV